MANPQYKNIGWSPLGILIALGVSVGIANIILWILKFLN
jgi:hypothetical protein